MAAQGSTGQPDEGEENITYEVLDDDAEVEQVLEELIYHDAEFATKRCEVEAEAKAERDASYDTVVLNNDRLAYLPSVRLGEANRAVRPAAPRPDALPNAFRTVPSFLAVPLAHPQILDRERYPDVDRALEVYATQLLDVLRRLTALPSLRRKVKAYSIPPDALKVRPKLMPTSRHCGAQSRSAAGRPSRVCPSLTCSDPAAH